MKTAYIYALFPTTEKKITYKQPFKISVSVLRRILVFWFFFPLVKKYCPYYLILMMTLKMTLMWLCVTKKKKIQKWTMRVSQQLRLHQLCVISINKSIIVYILYLWILNEKVNLRLGKGGMRWCTLIGKMRYVFDFPCSVSSRSR